MGIEAAKRKGRVFCPAEPVALRVRCISSLPRSNFSGQEVWRADFVISDDAQQSGLLSGKPCVTLQVSGLRQNRFMASAEYVLTLALAGRQEEGGRRPAAGATQPHVGADAFQEFVPYMLAEEVEEAAGGRRAEPRVAVLGDGDDHTGDEFLDYMLDQANDELSIGN